jgi:hypothetical protein
MQVGSTSFAKEKIIFYIDNFYNHVRGARTGGAHLRSAGCSHASQCERYGANVTGGYPIGAGGIGNA